jgi:hypothetical protein
MNFIQVFNMQRLAVLTTALGQSPPDPELIYEAMKDRVHQPYRKHLVGICALMFWLGVEVWVFFRYRVCRRCSLLSLQGLILVYSESACLEPAPRS